MPIYNGTTKIVSFYKGTTKIVKRYRGTDVIYTAVRLPSEYQQVEYIASSGTQYIDTGIGSTNTTGVKLDAQFTSAGILLGVLEANVGRFQPYFREVDSIIAHTILGGGALTITTTKASDRNTYEYNVSNRDIKFNGTSVGSVGNIGATSNHIYIFKRNHATPVACSAKLYSLKLYDNGTLTRDFVPCYRKSDFEVGLYDLVNDVFYTNQGTGAFTKGGDV